MAASGSATAIEPPEPAEPKAPALGPIQDISLERMNPRAKRSPKVLRGIGPSGSKRLSSKPIHGPVTHFATASSIVAFDKRRTPSISPPQASAPKIRASDRPLV